MRNIKIETTNLDLKDRMMMQSFQHLHCYLIKKILIMKT